MSKQTGEKKISNGRYGPFFIPSALTQTLTHRVAFGGSAVCDHICIPLLAQLVLGFADTSSGGLGSSPSVVSCLLRGLGFYLSPQ